MYKMLDVGSSASHAARAAVAKVSAAYADESELPPIAVGAFVWYVRGNGSTVPGRVERLDEEARYVIRSDCDMRGPDACVRVVERRRLVAM